MTPTRRELQIRRDASEGRVRLSLSGELDIASAPRLDDAVREAETTAAREICVDLRTLGFIDSSGLRAILSAQERSNQDGKRLTVIRGPERIHRLFTIARVADRISFKEPGDAQDGYA